MLITVKNSMRNEILHEEGDHMTVVDGALFVEKTTGELGTKYVAIYAAEHWISAVKTTEKI